jgi:small subunit ribosomal protein S5
MAEDIKKEKAVDMPEEKKTVVADAKKTAPVKKAETENKEPVTETKAEAKSHLNKKDFSKEQPTGAYSSEQPKYNRPKGKKSDFKRDKNRGQRHEDSEFDKTLVEIRRVSKAVKGGSTRRFSATVVVGDKKGRVGVGIGKAAEVPLAIDKATAEAKKDLKTVNILNGTIPHSTVGKYRASQILMFPAKPGTGIIAGGSARAVLELAGLTDIVTKIHGSSNKINVVKATLAALIGIKSKEQIAEKRGKSVDEI